MQDAGAITVLIDTRERRPLIFPPVVTTKRVTLRTGDYSIRIGGTDYRDVVAIERKSLGDLLGCIGSGRRRFERELARLAAIPHRALIVEASLPDCAGGYRYSTLTQQQVIGTLMSWWLKFAVPAIFACDRTHAAQCVLTLLRLASKYSPLKEQRDG
jgi:DNA excision repair protein ERCC-4